MIEFILMGVCASMPVIAFSAMRYAEEHAKNAKQETPDSSGMQIQELNEKPVKDTWGCIHEVPCKFCSKMPTIRIAESSNTFSDNPYAEIECTNCGILVADDTGKNREDCVLSAIHKWNGMMQ